MDDASSKSLRWSWRLSGASIVLAVAASLAANALMHIGVCSAWIFGVAALVCAGKAIRQTRQAAATGGVQPRRSSLRQAVILALGLIGVGTFMNLWVVVLMDHVSGATATGLHLTCVGHEMQAYAEKHGEYPTPEDMLSNYGIVRRSERNASAPPCSKDVLMPYTVAPTKTPKIILVYGPERWIKRRELRLLSPLCRWVLFADGRVELLDKAQFEEALKKDAAKRKELEKVDGVSTMRSQPAG